jgi:hypothetical protein
MQYLYRYASLGMITGLFLTLAACSKDPKDNTEVTIANRIDDVVTVDIYGSAEDYKNSSNLVLRKTIEAGDKLILPGTTFPSGKAYYMDWYTDGYLHNNWFNDAYNSTNKEYVVINPKVGSNTYYTDVSFKSKARRAYLNNTQAGTTWHAIGAYLYSQATGYLDTWGELNANERYHRITISKDFKAMYEYRDASGIAQTITLPFKVHHSDEAYLEFFDAQNKSIGEMLSGQLPTGVAPNYEASTLDTVMALLPGTDYSFMMVKE